MRGGAIASLHGAKDGGGINVEVMVGKGARGRGLEREEEGE